MRRPFFFFFFNDTATTEIYTLSLHDALPIPRYRLPVIVCSLARGADDQCLALDPVPQVAARVPHRGIGLHVALCVSGPHGDHMRTGPGGSPGVLPGSEGIGAMIRAQCCCCPAAAIVLRELHLLDRAITTESDALHPHRQPGRQLA